jgi:hypothetical protein
MLNKTIIDADFLRFWDGKVNPADFTYSFLNGQFRASPEFLVDLEAYHDISPGDLLSYVRDSLVDSGHKGEVDIRISMMRSFRPRKESLWELRLVVANTQMDIVAKMYFSGLPIKPAKIESAL